jgi:hypothetical protein
MTTPTKIEVILRMCPESAKPLNGGARPGWFSKEKCLASLLAGADSEVRITVLYDGDELPTWLTTAPVSVQKISGRSGDTSFLTQLDYALRTIQDESTIVYILEDDYLHLPSWANLLREAFEDMEPHIIHPSYATLYDHYDKYIYSMYSGLHSRIAVTPSCHWRTIPSTTNTFACLLHTLRADADIHISFQNRDNDKFLKLGKERGRVVISSIPGAATHAHAELLSPCVDWNAVLGSKGSSPTN